MADTSTPERAADPTPEAWAFARELERDDDQPWDEDFLLALARSFDAFAQAAVERERERCAESLERRAAQFGGIERSLVLGEELKADARRIRQGGQP